MSGPHLLVDYGKNNLILNKLFKLFLNNVKYELIRASNK